MTIQELVDLQCLWLDTSQVQRASRITLNQVIIIALDHLKYQHMGRKDAKSSLCGKLLKLRQTFEPPVAACNEEEVHDLIASYVDAIYKYFDIEWSGSVSTLTHKREALEDTYYVHMLERRGEKRGGAGRGQGRKSQLKDPVGLSFLVERDVADRLKAQATSDDRPYGDLLREMVNNLYGESEKP